MQKKLVILVLSALCGMGQLCAMETACKGPVCGSPVPFAEPTMKRVLSSHTLLAMMHAPGWYATTVLASKPGKRVNMATAHDGACLVVLTRNMSNVSLDDQAKSPKSCKSPTTPDKKCGYSGLREVMGSSSNK